MLHHVRRLLGEERGATLVEYSLMVGLISVVSLAVVGAIGDAVFDTFDTTNDEIQTNGNASQPPTTPPD